MNLHPLLCSAMTEVKVWIHWNGNYGACCDDLLGCIATAATLEGIKKEFAEALEFHLEGMREDGDVIPDVFDRKYELKFELTDLALIHYAGEMVNRSALSKFTGISKTLLDHYFIGNSVPRPQQVERIKNGMRAIAAQLSALCL